MFGIDVVEILARDGIERRHHRRVRAAETFLQIVLDALQCRRLALLDGVELSVGQADRSAGCRHRGFIRGFRPRSGGGVRTRRQAKRTGGGDHPAARDRAERSCHPWLFLVAGNIISVITYRNAAHNRTRLKPASRAIRFASGVATTEKAPLSPQAHGRKPPDPVRDSPNGNGSPSASDTGASVTSTSAARANQGRSS